MQEEVKGNKDPYSKQPLNDPNKPINQETESRKVDKSRIKLADCSGKGSKILQNRNQEKQQNM